MMIAHACGIYADAYLVALTRISGIVGGVFVMLLLSVIILPKSASHEVPHTEPLPPVLCFSVPQAACSPLILVGDAYSRQGAALKCLMTVLLAVKVCTDLRGSAKCLAADSSCCLASACSTLVIARSLACRRPTT